MGNKKTEHQHNNPSSSLNSSASVNADELQSIASQLSCPRDEAGLKMGDMMDRTNIYMTRECIRLLDLKSATHLLELGHGNGGHIQKMISRYPQIRYTGLEISPLMKTAAEKLNNTSVTIGRCHFALYKGSEIPFEDNSFDRIMTVNTVYFWKEPETFLKEIIRVLKPGGYLAVTFGDRAFMETLPFTRYDFTLYDPSRFSELLQNTPYTSLSFYTGEDEVESKAGTLVKRKFHTALIRK